MQSELDFLREALIRDPRNRASQKRLRVLRKRLGLQAPVPKTKPIPEDPKRETWRVLWREARRRISCHPLNARKAILDSVIWTETTIQCSLQEAQGPRPLFVPRNKLSPKGVAYDVLRRRDSKPVQLSKQQRLHRARLRSKYHRNTLQQVEYIRRLIEHGITPDTLYDLGRIAV